jgi:hypothetical protein
MPDVTHKDQFADTSMANSDSQEVAEASRKAKESLEPSGEKKSSEGNPRMLIMEEPEESMRLEISSGVRTTSTVAEQEVHSRFVKAEVSISYVNCIILDLLSSFSVGRLPKYVRAVFYFIFCWDMHFD